MRFLTLLFAVGTSFGLAACGGNVVVDGGASSGSGGTSMSGSTTSTTSGGCGHLPGGDCVSDADCGGGTCTPVTPGGYRVCANVVPEAMSCTTPTTPMDQCCTTADCTNGQRCFASHDVAECFGGPVMPQYNMCVTDECASDADCPGNSAPRVCLPAGAFHHPLRACLPAYCRTDADCSAEPCGACVPVSQPCCDYPAGLGCVYPGGCSKNSDCSADQVCELDLVKGTGACVAGPAPCPL